MTRRRFPWLLAAATAANLGLALAVWSRQPWAGGPAEWRWEYLEPGARPPGAAADAGMAGGGGLLPLATILAAIVCLELLWAGRRAADRRGALPLAIASGMALSFGLVAWQPGGFAREMAALVSRNSFGYVWDAALAPPSGALLADYPAASADLNQHSVTHPPGPLLLVRALGALDFLADPPGGGLPPKAGAAPGAATNGASLTGLAAAAIDREVQQARRHGRPLPPQPPSARTVAALAVLLPALSALAAWPLFGLAVAWGCERREALLAALLWLLVPARSLFTPSLDQALPVLAAGAAWLAARGGRRSAAAAGGLLFAACFTSYGCLALLPLVAVCALAAPSRPAGDAAAPRQPGHRAARRWQRLAALALGFLLPYLLLALFAGHDPWHAMRAALALHHRIAVAPRSYATWLLWNPYDFALLLSPAVLALAAMALALRRPAGSDLPGAACREVRQSQEAPPGWPAGRPWRLTVVAWWCVLALLLLTGSVRGEAGRIWLPWMPFACAFAAATAWRRAEPRGAAVPLLLASQAALILALAARMAFVL
jgi:hypothetical protein